MNASAPPPSAPVAVPAPAPAPMSPGDEAPEGTPGTAEDVCRVCGGSGRSDDGSRPCPECQGTGKVNVGIGGA